MCFIEIFIINKDIFFNINAIMCTKGMKIYHYYFYSKNNYIENAINI